MTEPPKPALMAQTRREAGALCPLCIFVADPLDGAGRDREELIEVANGWHVSLVAVSTRGELTEEVLTSLSQLLRQQAGDVSYEGKQLRTTFSIGSHRQLTARAPLDRVAGVATRMFHGWSTRVSTAVGWRIVELNVRRH